MPPGPRVVQREAIEQAPMQQHADHFVDVLSLKHKAGQCTKEDVLDFLLKDRPLRIQGIFTWVSYSNKTHFYVQFYTKEDADTARSFSGKEFSITGILGTAIMPLTHCLALVAFSQFMDAAPFSSVKTPGQHRRRDRTATTKRGFFRSVSPNRSPPPQPPPAPTESPATSESRKRLIDSVDEPNNNDEPPTKPRLDPDPDHDDLVRLKRHVEVLKEELKSVKKIRGNQINELTLKNTDLLEENRRLQAPNPELPKLRDENEELSRDLLSMSKRNSDLKHRLEDAESQLASWSSRSDTSASANTSSQQVEDLIKQHKKDMVTIGRKYIGLEITVKRQAEQLAQFQGRTKVDAEIMTEPPRASSIDGIAISPTMVKQSSHMDEDSPRNDAPEEDRAYQSAAQEARSLLKKMVADALLARQREKSKEKKSSSPSGAAVPPSSSPSRDSGSRTTEANVAPEELDRINCLTRAPPALYQPSATESIKPAHIRSSTIRRPRADIIARLEGMGVDATRLVMPTASNVKKLEDVHQEAANQIEMERRLATAERDRVALEAKLRASAAPSGSGHNRRPSLLDRIGTRTQQSRP